MHNTNNHFCSINPDPKAEISRNKELFDQILEKISNFILIFNVVKWVKERNMFNKQLAVASYYI